MRLKFKWIFTLLMLALSMQFSFAQEKNIKGVVTDESGPIPGVNVVVKGTKVSTQTDFNGVYSIQAKPGDVLQFSFMGMNDSSVTVGASNSVNAKLTSASQSLDEVVVVAYGKQKTKSIVGSVATVGKDILEKQQATNVLTAIQGSVAGVNIISAGGQPGESPNIRIRGIGSISSSAEPLIILDGAPFSGNINSISSDQIESMSVLKDASSTALYGSRGANGVIIITTKRGKFNTPVSVHLNSVVGVGSNAVKLHKLLPTDRFMELSWEARRNVNQYGSGQTPAVAGQNASNSLISALGYNPYKAAVPVDANGKLVTTDKYWDTDWEKALINNSAIRKENSIAINGGGENAAYSFTANNLNQEGALVNSNFKRTSIRVSVDTKINESLTSGLSIAYGTSTQNYPTQSGNSFQSPVQWIYNVSSIYPIYRHDAQGNEIFDNFGGKLYDYGTGSGLVNATRPLMSNENALGALYNYTIKNDRDDVTINGYAGYKITKDLSFKTTIGYQRYLFDNFNYSSSLFGNAASVGGRITQNRDITTSINITNVLSYKKQFGNHNFGIDAIQEAYKLKIDRMYARGEGFLAGVEVNDGATKPAGVGGSITEERLNSYLGRATYNYANRYFLEGSYRTDGSSRFARDSRWGNFFSIGGAWSIKDESFLVDSKIVSTLKLKGSYGELGNNRAQNTDGTDSYFPYQQLYNLGFSEINNAGVVLGAPADKKLTWEKTASSNIGIELGFLNDRFKMGADWYQKKSIDLIYAVPVAGSTGNTTYVTNAGSLKNFGLEVYLSSVNVKNANFTWNTDLNFSFDRNEVTSLTQDYIVNGTKRWEVGRSIYDFWVQEWAGVDPATGRGQWYKDGVDANGNRNTTFSYTEASRNYVGKSSLPDVVGGLSNYFKYKNFDMNILFNFSYGAYVYDSSYASLMTGLKDPGRPGSVDLENRWQQPGDITDTPRLYQGTQDYASQSTRFLFKNNYIRLKALNIGYNFPKDVMNSIGVNNVRIYLQGDNLLTFQSHKGIDPEQSFAGTTDSRTYNQRLASLGFSIDF
ncbi:TonB-dependent receptor [Flavobacterium sp. F-65]|jgi:TonB-linked SusC/RagA family outer membrane protein|uniref:TonB-dependent receptor n=1 Tax=Flavobacterium pisciphilum TaxID=2893755 RepID=A0ABS8MZ21_9FLAO|nr:TonB-dependent receptor [Flavobacterium sp. F-65]MCC9073352.1 TonB-dependent receptor [Flavobacterium sp. F-65]